MHYRVQIPAYNEEHTIRDVILGSLTTLTEMVRDGDQVSALIINDGSTDGTGLILCELAHKDTRINVIENTRNRGLGYSFVQGVEHALGQDVDMIVHIDGDGQFNPRDIPALTAPVLRGEADLVLGSRFVRAQMSGAIPPLRKWGNRFLSQIVTLLTGKKIMDASCGFRVFSKRAMARLRVTSRFTYTHQSILTCAFAKVAIVEVPIEIRPNREHGVPKISANVFRYGLLSSGGILNCIRVLRPIPFYCALLLLSLAVTSFFWR